MTTETGALSDAARAGVPAVAWRRPIGLPLHDPPRPRVTQPLIDDGPWGGVPIGGIGAGSIGRTHRGDFARWHLEVGQHRFESVPACQFSVFTQVAGGTPQAHVLSTIRPDTLSSWAWDLPVGAGTYHALYPAAWFEYDWDVLPVELVQKQFSPVLPHDYRVSSYPVGIFDWEVTNRGPDAVTVGVMFSWQDPFGERARAVAADGVAGLEFSGERGTMAIVAPAGGDVDVSVLPRFDADGDGSEAWDPFAAEGRLGGMPSSSDRGSAGDGRALAGAVAVTVTLQPGRSRTLPFALAWDLPVAGFGAGTRWFKRYTRFFGRDGRNAWTIAREGLDRRVEWGSAIDAWQRPILEDSARPDWYKAALFNELYFMADGGTVWTDGPPQPGPGSGDGLSGMPTGPHAADAPDGIGRFAIIECFDYPFYNTLDVYFYASFALLRLWPELERSVIRDFVASVAVVDPAIVTIETSGKRAARKLAGALPHDLGGPSDDPFLRPNHYRYQDVNIWKDLNCKFVLQVYRDALLLGDTELVAHAWPAVVTALDHLGRFDRDGDGLPEHDGEPDQTYDTWPMAGPSAYGGGLWLAALAAATAMAEQLGDREAVRRYGDASERGAATYLRRLWNGRYFRYDSGGASSDSVMADQLAGQWYADVTGLGDLVPREHVATALRTVFESNVLGFAGGAMGAVNGMRSDGTVDESSEQSPEVWVGTTYALAAFMLGRGLVDEAWRTAWGPVDVTYRRGFWFRTPEAYDRNGDFRASLYLRPLAIWAIEEALDPTRPPEPPRGG